MNHHLSACYKLCWLLGLLLLVEETQGFVSFSGTRTTRPMTKNLLFRANSKQRTHQFPARTISTALNVVSPMDVTAILRGGAAAVAKTGAVSLSREGLKLQSMAQYSTITALVMNASLRLFTSQKFNIQVDADGKRPRMICVLESIFTASTTLCIVCGTFTAVLFNILGIYSKEALGVGCEEGYVAFQHATAIYRKWGFRTFLLTCLSFVTSFLISVVEKTSNEDTVGQAILLMSILLALVGVFHIHTVLGLATKYIYTVEMKSKNYIA